MKSNETMFSVYSRPFSAAFNAVESGCSSVFLRRDAWKRMNLTHRMPDGVPIAQATVSAVENRVTGRAL